MSDDHSPGHENKTKSDADEKEDARKADEQNVATEPLTNEDSGIADVPMDSESSN